MKSPKRLKDKKAWLLILLEDTKTFQRTRKALHPMIREVMGSRSLDMERQLFRFIDNLVVVAAINYLENVRRSYRYSFATYFTWYVREAVRTFNIETGRVESIYLAFRLEDDGITFRKTSMPKNW